MSGWKVAAVACVCAWGWAGTAPAQVLPAALPQNPKVLTTPNGAIDAGSSVIPSGTGFLLGWNSAFGFNGNSVFVRQFSNKGVATMPMVTLRKNIANLFGHPKFAPTTAGKFAVVWQSLTQDFNQTPFIEGGIFDTATNKIGAIKTIGDVTSPVHDVIQMTTGNLAVVAQQQSKTSAQQKIVVYTLNGTTFAKLKGPVSVNGAGDVDIGQSYDHTIVPRQAGGYVIFRNRASNPSTLMMRGFNQDAALDAKTIRVNSTPFLVGIIGNDLLKFSVRATRLTNTNIVVTWAHFLNTNNSYEVRARLFTNDGVALGNDFQVNKQTAGDQLWPKPIALANGKFAIAWLADGEAINERHHYVRFYSASGVPTANPLLTQKAITPSSETIDNSVVQLSDKSFVDVFHDSNFNQERVLGDGIPAPTAPAAPIDIGTLQ